MEEVQRQASTSQQQTSMFNNLLRQKFLKSFEEKIKEIETVRVREYEEQKLRHETELRLFKETFERVVSEKVQCITLFQQRIKKLVSASGVKSIEDFL